MKPLPWEDSFFSQRKSFRLSIKKFDLPDISRIKNINGPNPSAASIPSGNYIQRSGSVQFCLKQSFILQLLYIDQPGYHAKSLATFQTCRTVRIGDHSCAC